MSKVLRFNEPRRTDWGTDLGNQVTGKMVYNALPVRCLVIFNNDKQ